MAPQGLTQIGRHTMVAEMTYEEIEEKLRFHQSEATYRMNGLAVSREAALIHATLAVSYATYLSVRSAENRSRQAPRIPGPR